MTKQQIDIFIAQGEGQYIEFKERLDKSFAKEVCAFANASGGKILLGIDDTGVVKGIEDSNKLRSQIQDLARNSDPSIIVEIEYCDKVIIVTIPDSTNKPHSVSDGFYRRIGANSQKLTRDEVFAMGLRSGRLKFDEQLCYSFDIEKDLDHERLKNYIKQAELNFSCSAEETLINLHLVRYEEGKQYMTNAGILFFAKDPEQFLKSTKVFCALYQGDSKANILDRKIFNGSLIENIDSSINYALQHIDVRFEIKNVERKEIPQYPTAALREAIVNALMHRDYYDSSGDTMVEIFKHSIRISNPGGLVSWLSPADFGKYSRCRNELIANLMLRTPYVEKMGTGIRRINDALAKYHLPKARFEYDEYNFAIIFEPDLEQSETTETSSQKTTQKSSSEKLPKNAFRILKLIEKDNKITQSKLADIIGVSPQQIRTYIRLLKDEELIRREGARKDGYWQIITS